MHKKFTLAELTNYPHEYRFTEWNTMGIETVDDEIIKNRNEFGDDFEIKKLYYYPQYFFKWLEYVNKYIKMPFKDHIEAYKLPDNKVIYVLNCYIDHLPLEQVREFQARHGFKMYPSIFNKASTTLYKIIDRDVVKNLPK